MTGDADRGLPAAVFGADPDVGRDLAQVDWAATPLGSPSGWPQSLQTAVSILLSSRFPMWMAWGPELTFFCNAAYRRDTLGRKYPWALGRPANEVWSEIWDDIGPRIDRVLSTGAGHLGCGRCCCSWSAPGTPRRPITRSPTAHCAMTTGGSSACCAWSARTRIRSSASGGWRRCGTSAPTPSVVRTEEESLAFAHRQLGQNLRDLPFTLTYLFDDGGDARLAGTSGIAAGHPAAPAVLPADGGCNLAGAAGRAGRVRADRTRRRSLFGTADRRLARTAGESTGGPADASRAAHPVDSWWQR